jgi:alpha-1,6-mannosyltransferase
LVDLAEAEADLDPRARRVARPAGSARVIRVRGPASPYDPSYHLLLNTRKIRRLIAREHPDVLEIHSPYMAALAALGAKRESYGVRTFQWHSDFIDTYGGVLASHAKASVRAYVRPMGAAVDPMLRPLWALVRAIGKRCDATLAASRWQVDKLRAHGVPNVIHRPFGIERAVFRPEARSSEGRRELLALASRPPDDPARILVGLGRFAIEKRWDVVLDAFAKVRERERTRRRDLVLILFGDGPERSRMVARARGDACDVVFPGFTKGREALARSLASADVLVHGCPFETFGLSIAEAMACGLPAVVPDQGGAAEMHDPASGELYPSLDADACAGAIERILGRIDASEASMRAAAAAKAAELPTVRQQFEKQIAIYEELLARPGAREDGEVGGAKMGRWEDG